MGVAEFAVQYVDNFDGKSIQTWVYKQDREKGFYDFAIPTKHTLQFFSDYVGPFAYEKLANVQNVYYFIMSVYGWILWTSKNTKIKKEISFSSKQENLISASLCIFFFLIIQYALNKTDC